jgi:UDP-glucuronate 4-epimerase
MHKPPQANSEKSTNSPDTSTSKSPYKLYNIGNNSPVELMTFIEVIEKALGKTAEKNFLPMQPGDVPSTYADVDDLMRDVGFKPSTTIDEGIHRFVQWYREYYKN